MKIALTIAAGLATLAAPLAAEEAFYVVNRTGYTIEQVYLAPTRTSNWEEDVLEEMVLDDGETFKIDMSRSEDTCLWDLRVVYTDGEDAQWGELNLCEMSTVVLRYDRKRGTWATTD
ncbi:MAG: hypothetical protein ACEQR8_09975 [Cypionkella sp.]